MITLVDINGTKWYFEARSSNITAEELINAYKMRANTNVSYLLNENLIILTETDIVYNEGTYLIL